MASDDPPRPGSRPRWARRLAAAVVAAALLSAAALVVYRVLAPAEVVTVAHMSYPGPPAAAPPAVIGTLAVAPLIVDGRVRVYAAQRQVRADGPVDARTQRSPYWSYRRWPQQLVGVVAAGATVVTRWSDGLLVALDARTGRIGWRTVGPAPEHGRYVGRRTGATTVYTPDGFYTATAPGGRRIVLVAGDDLRGFDVASGRELWRTPFEGRANCRGGGFTTTAGRFGTLATCSVPPVLEFYDVTTGRLSGRWRPVDAGPGFGVVPGSCVVGTSGCASLLTTGDGGERGWLLGAGDPMPCPPLATPGARLVDNVVVSGPRDGPPFAAEVTGHAANTGRELWRWSAAGDGGRARVVATQPGRVYLLTEAHELVTLDPTTGVVRSRLPLTYGRDRTDWVSGQVYASDGFVAVERLAEPVDPTAGDRQYYLSSQPVILART